MKNDTKRRGSKSLSKKYSATISIIVANIQISEVTSVFIKEIEPLCK